MVGETKAAESRDERVNGNAYWALPDTLPLSQLRLLAHTTDRNRYRLPQKLTLNLLMWTDCENVFSKCQCHHQFINLRFIPKNLAETLRVPYLASIKCQ